MCVRFASVYSWLRLTIILLSVTTRTFASTRYIFPNSSDVSSGRFSSKVKVRSSDWRPSPTDPFGATESEATTSYNETSLQKASRDFGEIENASDNNNKPNNFYDPIYPSPVDKNFGNSEQQFVTHFPKNRRQESGLIVLRENNNGPKYPHQFQSQHTPVNNINKNVPFYSGFEHGSVSGDKPGYSDFENTHLGDYYSFGHGFPSHQHQYLRVQSMEPFEPHDKVFSKTLIGIKALKLGKLLFTLFMVLIVFVVAAVGKLGVSLSPVVLPIALLPLGVIALLLFIQLVLALMPLVASGFAGDNKKRRKRTFTTPSSEKDEYLLELEYLLDQALEKIGLMELEGQHGST